MSDPLYKIRCPMELIPSVVVSMVVMSGSVVPRSVSSPVAGPREI